MKQNEIFVIFDKNEEYIWRTCKYFIKYGINNLI